MKINELTEQIIAAAIDVHRELGPGLLESTYEACKGVRIDCGYRIDLLVERQVVVELKAVHALDAIHEAQLLSYRKLSGCQVGLLINFNVKLLEKGPRRLVNALVE